MYVVSKKILHLSKMATKWKTKNTTLLEQFQNKIEKS